MQDVQAVLSMLELKMRAEKKTKFVQHYPDLKKEIEKCIDEGRGIQDINNEYGHLTKLDIPEFNY